jgi:flagellar operon protein (TIGR03826 family)
MALANCVECGRLFNKMAREQCPLCLEQIEKDFETVYKFLRDNGTAHIDTIHEHTGVEKKRIMKFLSEGRFEGVTIQYKCDSCGEPISNGKLCEKCVRRISKEIEQLKPGSHRTEQKSASYLGHTSLDRYRK